MCRADFNAKINILVEDVVKVNLLTKLFVQTRKNGIQGRVRISCLQFAICEAFWHFANELLHFFLKIANRENQILHELLELFIELAIWEVILSLISMPC